MKPQDILFIIVLGLLLWNRNPKNFLIAAITCIVLSMPLFYNMNFFTAERLVMYAVGFLFIALVLMWSKIVK